jgi:hypothetical protein
MPLVPGPARCKPALLAYSILECEFLSKTRTVRVGHSNRTLMPELGGVCGSPLDPPPPPGRACGRAWVGGGLCSIRSPSMSIAVRRLCDLSAAGVEAVARTTQPSLPAVLPAGATLTAAHHACMHALPSVLRHDLRCQTVRKWSLMAKRQPPLAALFVLAALSP